MAKAIKRNKMSDNAQEIYRHMNTYEYADELFRKEYTQLRSMLNKRIARAKASGYQQNMGYFPTLKNIPNREAFSKELAQAREYAENPLSTAAGRRERENSAIEALHERGFENINRKNFGKFKEFMNAMQNKYTAETPDGKKKFYDSDKAAEFFDSLEQNTISSNTATDLMDIFVKWGGQC